MAYFINNNNQWVEPKQVLVNEQGNWTPVKSIYINTGTAWSKVYPASGSTSYSTPGFYRFTVPNGIYNLNVSYPTTSSLVTSEVSVIPGQQLFVNVGTFGSGSQLGTLQMPAYEVDVFDIITQVNDSLIVQLGVTTSSNSVQTFIGSSGSSPVGLLGQALDQSQSNSNNDALMAAASTAGFFVSMIYDSLGGREAYNSTIELQAVPQSTVIYDVNLYVKYAKGPSDGCSVLQQPTADNSYVGGFIFSDPAADPHQCNGKLSLQQIVGISITWG